MMERRVIFQKIGALLCLLLFLGSGCGYRFSGEDAPFGIQTLHVPILQNRTGETGIETIFTDDLIYEFTRNGAMRLRDAESAGAVLTGEIDRVSFKTISHKGYQVALERRVEVSMSLVLRDRNGKVLWAEEGISSQEEYPVSEDKLTTEYNRREAIKRISDRLAENVYNRLATDF